MQQPYLGCREFPAYFELDPARDEPPLPLSMDLGLGLMLYDVFPLHLTGASASPSLFPASIENGVLNVPPYHSEKVLK